MKRFNILFLFIFLTLEILGEGFYIRQGDEELRLDYTPKKIITDSAILSRFFDALDIDLVGVPNSSTKIPERYKDVERIGKAGIPDLEKVKALGTDLVVATLFSKPTIKPKYDMLNIPSFYIDVETYGESKEAVEILGKAFDREEKAQEILKEWERREKILQEKVENRKGKKIAIIYGNGESFFMTGKEHFLEELIEKIGCENVVTSLDKKATEKKSVPFSLEQLVLLNPDVILIMPNSKTKNGEVFKESFKTNSIWQLITAYKNQAIHIIDPTLFRMSAGVNSIDALEELYRYVYEN
ncbi:iron ABC transporter [Fusobacterium mortiferum]|uniref:Iron ABC transporter n=1 Tax=Fusobacterium mortiferum TaxID=850 RepID=A0A414PQ67_FUSMR|nr:ABC transporter substrate-binding protein [Fusobacterium mortiferum]MCI7665634.1 ABC transporter substrate-binding protein [Fusobacterium mortiferum]RHF70664.1 iron ABC transporter [Fusobacterium mortiferum]